MEKQNSLITVEELLSYYDSNFIFNAYKVLLRRNPDSTGLRYYLNRIRSGAPKISILAAIYHSPEGKEKRVSVKGLERAIKQYKQGLLPIIGWFFRNINKTEGLSSNERQLRSLENHIAALFSVMSENLQDIDIKIERLNQATKKIEKSDDFYKEHAIEFNRRGSSSKPDGCIATEQNKTEQSLITLADLVLIANSLR